MKIILIVLYPGVSGPSRSYYNRVKIIRYLSSELKLINRNSKQFLPDLLVERDLMLYIFNFFKTRESSYGVY